MPLIVAALRNLLVDAAIRGGKLLLTAGFGALLMLSACTVTAGVATLGMGGGATVRPGVGGPIGGGFDTTVPDYDLTAGGPLPTGLGRVTDVGRYQLAVAVGFIPGEDAILATALSIAENGAGDPAAMSPANWNGTRDLGLWQINSIHWPKYGGPVALTDPLTNARAAFGIAGPNRNWCAWSTYEVRCGVGYTGTYRSFMDRARRAALGG